MNTDARRAIMLPGVTLAMLPPGAMVVAVCWSIQQLQSLPPAWLIVSTAVAGVIVLGASLAMFARSARTRGQEPAPTSAHCAPARSASSKVRIQVSI